MVEAAGTAPASSLPFGLFLHYITIYYTLSDFKSKHINNFMDLELKMKIGWLRQKYDHPRDNFCEELDDRITLLKARIELANFKLGRSTSPNDRIYERQSEPLESLLQPNQDARSKHGNVLPHQSSPQRNQLRPSQPLPSPFQTALRQGAGLNQTSRRSTKKTGKSLF